MWSLGGYPAGAEYDSRAPWNEVDPEECVCETCGGSGRQWWRYDIEANESTAVTEEEYNALPTEQEANEKGERLCKYSVERCEVCGGEGVIWDE